MTLNETLGQLSNACGVTGRENEVRELMIRLMTPYADEIVVDKLEKNRYNRFQTSFSSYLRCLRCDSDSVWRGSSIAAAFS